MAADPAEEEQFGPYLVYERLGVGGMATVHRALERGIEGFERIVALKRLLPHLAEDASFIKSFVREAKLASLLNHVNIVQIFELGRVGTEYFISMEYIDGRDIRRILRHARKVTGPPPIHVTVGLLLQLSEALEYAHGKVDDEGNPLKLVHRDISPSNLLVTKIGHLKIIDFGIAKAQSTHLRTQTGRVKGKLAYMAPEAISGKDLDARSDLFAVGVIAHELLTARPLFARKNEYETLIKVQKGEIHPPSTFNQACPDEMDAIVLKALARDPEERYASAADFRDDLLALRKQYNLQTGHRDVAQWLDWAFKLETPSAGFGPTTTSVGSDPGVPLPLAQGTSQSVPTTASAMADRVFSRHLTPRPQPRKEDEDAVEVAWGAGEQEEAGAPVVLDDVPDVSDKHLGVRVDLSDIDSVDPDHDDIPASQPSHGHAMSMRAPTQTPRAATGAGLASIKPDSEGSAPALPPPPTVTFRAPSPSLSTKGTGPTQAIPATPTQARRVTAQGNAVARPTPPITPDPDFTGEAPRTGPVERGSDPATTSSPPRPARALSEVATLPPPDDVVPPRTPSLTTTRPGAGVTSARRTAAAVDALTETDAIATQPRNKRPSNIQIGQSIVMRQSVKRGWVVPLVAVLVAGGVAAGLWFYLSRDTSGPDKIVKETPKEPPKPTATIKFVVEPSDATVSIEGKVEHTGSPWSVELEPGTYTINIHRDGYKARLMNVELSPKETPTYIVPLEKLAANGSAVDEASLTLSSSPNGLAIVLDGKLLAQHTPLVRLPIKTGPHSILLFQNGSEVWRQHLVAQPSVDYEFSPSMSEDKKRERKEREKPPTVAERRTDGEGSAAAAVVEDVKAPDEKTTEKPRNPTSPSSITTPKTEVPLAPVPPAITQQIPAPPVALPPQARPSGPVVVPPTMVNRVSGETPNVGKSKNAEMPSTVAAKVCIDTAGKVTSVDVITARLERMTVNDLVGAIKSWRYAPYMQGGTAVPACFVVSFKVK